MTIGNKFLNDSIQAAINIGCMVTLKDIDIVTYTYVCAKQWYYSGEPFLSDVQFDELEDNLKKAWPDNPALQIVGLLHPKCNCG